VIVANVHIATGDLRRPWATGIAVRDGVIVALGSAAEVAKLRTAETDMIDAGGAEVRLPAGCTVGSQVVIEPASEHHPLRIVAATS